jgi:hypothetical protein
MAVIIGKMASFNQIKRKAIAIGNDMARANRMSERMAVAIEINMAVDCQSNERLEKWSCCWN